MLGLGDSSERRESCFGAFEADLNIVRMVAVFAHGDEKFKFSRGDQVISNFF